MALAQSHAATSEALWYDQIQPAYNELGLPNYETDDGELIPGIYTELPNPVYHSLPAISSSGLKKFSKSPAHFYREYLSSVSRARTKAQLRTFDAGTYGHELVLEPEGFYDRYYRGLIEAQMDDDVLITANALKNELLELGAPHSGSKADLAKRLHQLDPSKKIFSLMVEELAAENEGKTLIDGLVWDDAHRIQQSVYQNIDAPHLLTDGYPELSVIARCPLTGLLLKCRFDYIQRSAVASDVKTTRDASANGFRKQIEQLGYHLQEAFYTHVANAAQIPVEDFWFIAVEYLEADICEVYEINPDGKRKARSQCLQLLDEFKAVSDDNDWYGYNKDRKAKTLELSRWA